MINREAVQVLAASLRLARIPAQSIRLEYRLFEEQPVGRIGQIKISIDGKRERHKEKHFHTRLNSEINGSFGIPNGHPFASSFCARDTKLITEWARANRKNLEADWDAVERGEKPPFLIQTEI